MLQELVIVNVQGEHRIDSRLVAQSLGIEHRSFLKVLYTYEAELQELGAVRFQIAPRKDRNPGGDQPKFVMLNEDQAIFAATLSRNTRQVVSFKLQLTKAFSEARKQQQRTPSIHTLSDAMRTRAIENLHNVPEGYFSVMGELFKHLYNLEAMVNHAIDDEAMLEISVGQTWSAYARDVLFIPDTLRCKYRHKCQDGRIVQAWAYPLCYTNAFTAWLWESYFPRHFPSYRQYRARRQTLSVSSTNKYLR